MIGCPGVPDFDYAATQSWPIGGAMVQYATYAFYTGELLVIYADQSFVIVSGVAAFNVPQNTEAYVLGLIATNPTSCQSGQGTNVFILDQSTLDGGNVLA